MSVNDTWKSDDIPQKQYDVVKKELEDLRNGKPHEVWRTVVEFLKSLEGDSLSLLDVGCASGYFYEIFNTLLPGKFQYVGGDYSDAMLNLAKKNYPDVNFSKVDVRNIQFDDKTFDVSFSCACLEHVKDDWSIGLKELCRVSKKYVVLHKMPIVEGQFTHYDVKDIYGSNTIVFNKFNKNEVFDVAHRCGFKNIYDVKTHKTANVYRLLAFVRAGQK